MADVTAVFCLILSSKLRVSSKELVYLGENLDSDIEFFVKAHCDCDKKPVISLSRYVERFIEYNYKEA